MEFSFDSDTATALKRLMKRWSATNRTAIVAKLIDDRLRLELAREHMTDADFLAFVVELYAQIDG